MVGVSGTNSSSKSTGLSSAQHFVTPETSESGTATGNTFNLRAKALAVRQGYEQVQDQSSKKENKLDPAVLARIALEEELKKKGGGGGGSRSFNPMLWIPYSFKLLVKAIEELREAFNRALNQSLTAVPKFVSKSFINSINAVNRFFAPLLTPIVNSLARTFSSIAKGINDFIKNPIALTNKMLINAGQMAIVISSAIINGLKKVFFGKDEEKLEPDEKIYEEEESTGLLSRLLNFFTRTK